MKESWDHFPDAPYVKRLGPHRCAILDALEDAGGKLTLHDLCEVLHRNRPRDVRRRVLPMLEEAEIITVDGDLVTLAEDWLERLEEQRERTAEISYAEEQREKHRKQRERYREYVKAVKQLPSQVGRKSVRKGREKRRDHRRENLVGWVEETVGAPLSPLAVAVRDYLDRYPHQARQPAGWIGVTLWADGLHPKLDNPPADTKAAIEELGGAVYLDRKLKEAKAAA